MMRSTDECEMSRSCHSATFSSPACEVAAQHAGQTAELLGLHRVALVRHRARALLRAGRGTAPRPRRTSVRCRWRISSRERLDRRADRRARVEQLGVAVAGEHLRGRHRPQPEPLAHVRLDLRDRRWSRCRPRPTACRPRSASRARDQAHAVAAQLQRPQRELGSRRWWARRGCRGCGPTIGVSRCSRARAVIAASSASTASMHEIAAPARA